MAKFQAFLQRKDIVFSGKRYGIDALGAMAQGLFCSLLVGTIVKTLGQQLALQFLIDAGTFASAMSGAAMAVAIGYALKAPALVLFSLATVGYASNSLGGAGGPLAVLIIAILAAECGKAVSKETKIDILVTPLTTILIGVGLAALIAKPIGDAASAVGTFIKWATELQPLLMGIVVAVVVGVILTLPISSAAICAMIFSTSALEVAAANGTSEGFLLAGGAAVVGCCAQMVGFAVMSFRVNGWGGLVSQGLGTSMLQMPNICRKPQIWIAPCAAAAVVGPLSTMLFKLECTGVSAGMGTCGLVGPIGVIEQMGHTNAMMWIGLALLCIVVPAVLSLVFSLIMEKLGWYTKEDLKLAD